LCRPVINFIKGIQEETSKREEKKKEKEKEKKKEKKKKKEKRKKKKEKEKRKERRTFCLEGEVVCEVAALVISPEHEEGGGIPHLDGVEVENHLRKWKERK